MKKLIFLLLKYGMRFIYFFMKLLIPVRDFSQPPVGPALGEFPAAAR